MILQAGGQKSMSIFSIVFSVAGVWIRRQRKVCCIRRVLSFFSVPDRSLRIPVHASDRMRAAGKWERLC